MTRLVAAPYAQRCCGVTCVWLAACCWLVSPVSWAQDADSLTRQLSSAVSLRLVTTAPEHFSLSGIEVTKSDEPLFAVTVDSALDVKTPAMLGTYERRKDSLRFYPRFPLSPRVTYHVRLSEKLKRKFPDHPELRFTLPKPPAPTPVVDGVYPSASELPENLLKFYVHFSQPMSRGEAYRRITLWRDDEPVEDPFLELGEELWNARQTRFTLFIHPGRIKRGLKPREDIGPALSAGNQFKLRIDAGWVSAAGEPLDQTYEKQFSVVSPDHEQPNPERWQLDTPDRATRQPVRLRFDEALDHAMLQRVLTVHWRDGPPVPGHVAVTDGESSWSFVPATDWAAGTYAIHIAANLEDLSGNSIARPFEVKMQQQVAASPSTNIAVEFVVR